MGAVGRDFLSPALCEAELMARLLPRADFPGWLARFLPGIADGEPAALFTPAVVTDSADGQIAHLRGLKLSRAWCWRRLAETLPPGDPRVTACAHAAGTVAWSPAGEQCRVLAAHDRLPDKPLPHCLARHTYLLGPWLASIQTCRLRNRPALLVSIAQSTAR